MILFKKVTFLTICASSLLLVLTLSGSFSNFTYSESPVASDYYIKKYDVNQTFHNDCDFLNLLIVMVPKNRVEFHLLLIRDCRYFILKN